MYELKSLSFQSTTESEFLETEKEQELFKVAQQLIKQEGGTPSEFNRMSAAMKEKIYSAKVQNVNKALNLLRMRPASDVAKKLKKLSSTIDDRTSNHCCSCKMYNTRNRKKKKVASSGFSRALVPIEMRKCMMRHEWSNLVELLPLLLGGRSETEPLVWRYLAAALFYSSKANLVTLNNFLEMGVGSKSAEFLGNVLSLPSRATETEESEEIEVIEESDSS